MFNDLSVAYDTQGSSPHAVLRLNSVPRRLSLTNAGQADQLRAFFHLLLYVFRARPRKNGTDIMEIPSELFRENMKWDYLEE